MTREELESKIEDYLNGELNEVEQRELLEHIETDEDLKALLQSMESDDKLLDEYFTGLTSAALNGPKPCLPDRVTPRARARYTWPVYGVAAVFVLILTVAAILFSYKGIETTIKGREIGVALHTEKKVYYITKDGLRVVEDGMPILSKMRLKVPSRAYLSVKLNVPDPTKRGNIVELRENTVASFQDYRSQTILRLERGETWVHLNQKPDKAFAVKTREALVEHHGTIFNVLQGMSGTAVGVLDGSVTYDDDSGIITELDRYETISLLDDKSDYSLAEHIPWSRFSKDLLAMLPQEMKLAEEPVSVPLVAALAETADVAPVEDIEIPEGMGTLQTTELLPADTRLFVEIADVSNVIDDWNMSDYSDLLRDPALLDWWNGESMDSARSYMIDTLGAARWMRLVSAFDERLSVGWASDGAIVIVADCRSNADEITAIVEEDIRPLLNKWAAATGGKSQEAVKLQMKRGYLVFGVTFNQESVAYDLTMAAIDKDEPTGFTDSDFYWKIDDNVPNSRLTIAYDFKSTMDYIRAKAEPDVLKFLKRTGFDNLDYALGSPDFVGQGINQAFRVGFTGEREGVLSWLDEPAPMSSPRFFASDAHGFLAARIKDPEAMLSDMVRWEMEDSRQSGDSEITLSFIKRLSACLGNEIAIGIQNPVLPIPNIQCAIEAIDPIGFNDAVIEYIQMYNEFAPGNNINWEQESYRDRTIMSVSAIGMPFVLSWVSIDDFIIIGPGAPFMRHTVDVFEERQSLMDQRDFLSLLPETGRMNFSLLFYQDISRMAPRLVDQFKITSLTTREKSFVPDLDVMERFHHAGISYGISYDDHIDFYMNGSRGVDFNLGGTMPFVASLVMPKLFQHDLESQLLVAEKSLQTMQTAVEAYKIDNGSYPDYPEQLLHPMAYLSSIPIDPFSPDGEKIYYDVNQSQGTYVIYSIGPDEVDDLGLKKYDMNQGLRSEGDLVYTNKEDNEAGLAEFPQ